jgi:N-acetylmuramoyl-L-alanine amidase
MRIFILSMVLGLLGAVSVLAAVEIALEGDPVTVIDEVYHRDGMAYVAIDDLLPPLRLTGTWNAVEHVYRIEGAFGTALISPGSRFLRQGGSFELLAQKPRFIDGRLRVSDDFIRKHLIPLADVRVIYRDLNPGVSPPVDESSAMDRLFSFLLRKEKPNDAPQLRAIALDPGHGGQDPGSIGLNGVKEKDVTLALAQHLQKQVKMELGIPVYLTRDADYGLGLEDRFRTAAQPDVDALLLLHAQSSFGLQAQGVFLYVRPIELNEDTPASVDESQKLAEILSAALTQAGFVVQGILSAPLLPMGQGDLPTVLVEAGFLTNPDDRPILDAAEGQQRFAAALFAGLKKFGEKRQKSGDL